MERSQLVRGFLEVRQLSEELCRPLEIEDYVIQPLGDVSPPKWHLAHTSWLFEALVLQKYGRDYKPYHPLYSFLFNSYYESLGKRVERSQRGHLSRPTVKEVYAYRAHVSDCVGELINSIEEDRWIELRELVTLGLNHEQQHQELLITDIKFILARNPMRPTYRTAAPSCISFTERAKRVALQGAWISFDGGMYDIGWSGEGFCFDNEQPTHQVRLNPFRLQRRVLTNAEYLEFIDDGGYRDFRLWLSDGWDLVQREEWTAPLYWERIDGEWCELTLSGVKALVPDAPICHLSYYEADAFAHWANKRLPTEAEWEVAARLSKARASDGNFLDDQYFHPIPIQTIFEESSPRPLQMFGDVWEWTSSPYLPYPGYRRSEGPLGEYNAKFMINQMVLRGGSCASPRSHIRETYRNFFQPEKRWQFTGVRLADDA